MNVELLGDVEIPSKDHLGLIALTLVGIAVIGYGMVGYRNRQLTIRSTEYEGAAAQAWGVFLVLIGLGGTLWGVTGIGTWLHWWG